MADRNAMMGVGGVGGGGSGKDVYVGDSDEQRYV